MTVIQLSKKILSKGKATDLFFQWREATPDLFIVVKDIPRVDRMATDHQYFLARPIRDDKDLTLDRGREGKEPSFFLEIDENMSIIYPENIKPLF